MTEADTEQKPVAAETRTFDTEVRQLLKLMINSLYSNREIFLRELISNASDAIDKLRFLALTDAELQAGIRPPAIDLSINAGIGELVIEDTGIGMSRDEVIENLGTIARSGTAEFIQSLSGDAKRDANLIGQFGVGFYSSFIVADQVTVETRRAGEPAGAAVRWQSRGQGEYTLQEFERDRHGTRIVLKLSEEHRDLLDPDRLENVIRHYSNHVAFPIRLEKTIEAEGQGAETTQFEQINDTQALWTRPKAEIGEQEYQEFYGGLTGDFEPPSTWAHHHVEGAQCYSMLLYLPSRAPFDLAWNRDERSGLKLYINRVFIMDAAESLVPRYLRFVRGVVDSADLPLNVSREILQDSPLLSKIRSAVIRRSLDMLEKLAAQGGEDWLKVRDEFGGVLKEGIIEDPENRERIAALLRFDSTEVEGENKTSLADYLERAKQTAANDDDQIKTPIWYLLSDTRTQALSSPHLEAFSKQGTEVLLLTDPIDHWLVNHLFEFDGHALKSASSGELKLDVEADKANPDDSKGDATDSETAHALIESLKTALGDRVGNVIASQRLVDSASCLVEPPGALNAQMRKMLKQAGQEVPDVKPDLEINLDHPLLQLFDEKDLSGSGHTEALANILLGQALLVEGGELSDPAGFVKQVNQLLEQLMKANL